MSDIKQTKEDIMARVNGMITALNLYPNDSKTNTLYSINTSLNPLDLMLDFFKSTKGYDWLIEQVSYFIAYNIPVLEASVKGILLTNIQNMLSCSIKPIISEDMIKDGVVFDLNKIDLFNIFNYSPLDNNVKNPGRYYYFGCNKEDGIETIDDVKKSRDLNAVLWYAKNTPGERIIWRNEDDIDKPYIIAKKGTQEPFTWLKQVKSNGIATIEFNGRSSGLSNSEHSADYFVKEPIENCVHVFIGYCGEEPLSNTTIDTTECTRKISEMEHILEDITNLKEKVYAFQTTIKDEMLKNGSDYNMLNDIDIDIKKDLITLDKIENAINGININTDIEPIDTTIYGILQQTNFQLYSIHETIEIPSELQNTNIPMEKAIKLQYLIQNEQSSNKIYPSAKSNYYYGHPLMEWNTDFIMSTKLFDEKVVTAQLVDALTDCLKFTATNNFNGNTNITAQQQFIQSQLRDIIVKIIENDDVVISDCFFSFTNDSYNKLLSEVEMNRAGLQTDDGVNTNIPLTADTLLNSLNTLSNDASKEELQSVINSTLFIASSCTNPHDVGSIENRFAINGSFGFDFKSNMSILDQLLTKLTYVIVSTIIQPKVYILLMTNLKIMGNEPNFDLVKFMQQFNELISSLIRGVRDEILEFFSKKILEIIQEITKQLAKKLTLEQYQYYITLLTHCIECLKFHRNEYDWIQDDVNYADIYELNKDNNQIC